MRLPHLHVAWRTSSFRFRGAEDVRKIGEALGVGTILEGGVRTAGRRVRVTAQLTAVADGYHVWSERYDREMEDVFAIQDDIARAIVSSLRVQLLGTSERTIVKPNTCSLEAYELCLRGRLAWHRASAPSNAPSPTRVGSRSHLTSLGERLAAVGRTHEARLVLAELLERKALGTAQASQLFDLHLALGEHETALEWLARAVDDHDPLLGFSIRGQWTQALASNPKFAALANRVFG